MSFLSKARVLASTFYSYGSDMGRFWKYSQRGKPLANQYTAHSHILRLAHALEKGMVLPNPRRGYGLEKAEQLINAVAESSKTWGVAQPEIIAVSTVKGLLKFHVSQGVTLKGVQEKLSALEERFPQLANAETEVDAGSLTIRKADVISSLPKDPEAFFHARRSVRQFGENQAFDSSCISRATKMAQRAPSVCNRQTCKVYSFTDPAAIASLLKHQDGNSGFGQTASALMICTSDLSNFYKVGERNQGFVDGGLFAMALAYAFHSIGVGTCMLNWSQAAHKDKLFRRVCRIPDREVIITMMAVGPLRDEYKVAYSPRRSLCDVLIEDDNTLLSKPQDEKL